MKAKPNKPDSEQVLKALKDFQRRTVDHVFQRMYLDTDQTRRFLVADEVGLGKTLVARGLIAKVVDHLWDQVDRINVVYICSNADIARQNIARLYIADKHDFTPPSRLTLLPLHLRGLKDGRSLNFVAFTPGTSFDLKSRRGTGWERALLLRALSGHWKLSGRAPYNIFSVGMMNPDNFVARCKEMENEIVEEDVIAAFLSRLDKQELADKSAGLPSLRKRFDKLCDVFCRSDANPPRADIEERNAVLGELRMQMAMTCLDWLQPDLIIMDEFQRFKHLMNVDDESSDQEKGAWELAQGLFAYQDNTSAVRVLMLSATPYKMYTLNDAQEADSHYKDLLGSLGFLLNDKDRTAKVERLLDVYSKALHQITDCGMEALIQVKTELELEMRRVMARTERLSNSKDRNGMLREIPSDSMAPESKDIEHYLGHARVGRSLGSGSLVDYWKSAPYLLNFMEDYEIKRAFEDRTDSNTDPVLRQALLDAPGILLSHADLKRYRAIDPCNARLRGLIRDVVESGACKLLWLPTSLPYYQLFDEFAQPKLAKFTKRLVFSCWNVVPKVIAALVSYEAERRCQLQQNPKAVNTPEARKKKKPLLRFAFSDARLTGMPVIGIIYPAEHLASLTDPLALIKENLSASPDASPFQEVFDKAKSRVKSALDSIEVIQHSEGAADEDWYWVAPVLMDLIHQPESTTKWLEQIALPLLWAGTEDSKDQDEEGRWHEHVAKLRKFYTAFKAGSLEMGRQPDNLVDVLAWMGISGPGCCCLSPYFPNKLHKQELVAYNKAA